MPDNSSSKPTFEIALVMAGAVSAGAYTAGVLDFLFDALDRWYKQFDGNPPHDVKIKVMTGTSAGGMCTGISALQFVDKTDYQNRFSSKLYNSWVKMVDIGPMLTCSDLSSGKAESVLNSEIIDAISNKAFDVSGSYANLPLFVSDGLHVVLTVTNTRGVSYSVDFASANKKNAYLMTNYGDFFHFEIKRPGSTERLLDPLFQKPLMLNPEEPSTTNWSLLKEMCKATGAFPMGLKARVLKRPETQLYSLRFPPSHPANISYNKTYSFIGIDGGIINNEPFKYAHDILAGGAGKTNTREANKADKAVIMIDPFPATKPALNYDDTATDLPNVAIAFIKSLMGQAAFTPSDLQLAFQDDVRSRFLISPVRETPRGKGAGKFHVAGGALGAFSGFLDESYRNHDYLLGRRNCQHFLRKHFTLHKNNPLFAAWPSSFLEDFTKQYAGELDSEELPVIPLTRELWEPETEPAWPTLSKADYDKKIKKPLQRRFNELGKIFIPGKFLKKIWSWGLHKPLANKVNDRLLKELEDAELIR